MMLAQALDNSSSPSSRASTPSMPRMLQLMKALPTPRMWPSTHGSMLGSTGSEPVVP